MLSNSQQDIKMINQDNQSIIAATNADQADPGTIINTADELNQYTTKIVQDLNDKCDELIQSTESNLDEFLESDPTTLFRENMVSMMSSKQCDMVDISTVFASLIENKWKLPL
jgi:hypothetical protein